MYIGVSDLRITQRTTDTITVMWDPADSPNCGLTLYHIVTITNLAIPCDTRGSNVTLPTAEFSNLTNNVAYTISVTAVNRAGVGMETTINVSTLAVATSESSQGLLSYTIQYCLSLYHYCTICDHLNKKNHLVCT